MDMISIAQSTGDISADIYRQKSAKPIETPQLAGLEKHNQKLQQEMQAAQNPFTNGASTSAPTMPHGMLLCFACRCNLCLAPCIAILPGGCSCTRLTCTATKVRWTEVSCHLLQICAILAPCVLPTLTARGILCLALHIRKMPTVQEQYGLCLMQHISQHAAKGGVTDPCRRASCAAQRHQQDPLQQLHLQGVVPVCRGGHLWWGTAVQLCLPRQTDNKGSPAASTQAPLHEALHQYH